MRPRLAITDPAMLDAAARAGEAMQQAAMIRCSVSAQTAAASLDCDVTTIRALLRAGEIEGHHIGKGNGKARGVRIFVDSIAAYQTRHACPQQPVSKSLNARGTRPKPAAPGVGYRQAMARLAQMGLVVQPPPDDARRQRQQQQRLPIRRAMTR